MSSKIFITEETARQARSVAELPLFEERMVNLMRYRLRLIELAANGEVAGTYRKELKTLVKASDLIFGPGHGKRLKARAKDQPVYFAKDGGQAGTSHEASAILKPRGAGAGTSAEPNAKPSSDGRRAGTSSGAALPMKPRQAPWPRGPKAGTSLTQSGREAGVFVEQLPHDVADGWKAGRHPVTNGAGAGTPLQQAAEKYNDGAEAGHLPATRRPSDGRQAGHTPLDINWTPFDDFAVGGTFDEDQQQGRFIAKIIARKRGRS